MPVQSAVRHAVPAQDPQKQDKGSSKHSPATSELQYLMDFNSSITQAVVKTMEHFTDFVFVSMGNLTLARRDSYVTHVKQGIKPDTHFRPVLCFRTVF